MGDTSTPAIDPAIYNNNLVALHQAAPALARQLADFADPRATAARTRDGQLSFRIARADGATTWFGRSSIPSLRAQALLQKFDPGQANALLPGAAAGVEARLLLERLGRHRAVFVWEQELSAVQLLLRLHDAAQAIANERLVFIVCPPGELARTLLGWLEAHPGHLCPDRLMMWPWQTPAEIAPCRSAVEAAYHQIEHRRQRALGAIQASWPTTPARAIAGGSQAAPGSSVALLALHANDDALALIDALAEAVAALGDRATKVDVRSPADMHPLARATRLAETPHGRPELAILVDVTRHQVRDVLPPSIPAISWLGPQAMFSPDLAKQIGEDALAVTSPVLAERAAGCGLEIGRISVCPPPCLAPLKLQQQPRDTDRSIDVLLVADAGPVDAASVGLTLPAYAQIWTTAVDLLTAQIDAFNGSQVEAVFARAESKARARIDDPKLREEMVSALGGRVPGFILARFVAQRLSASGVSFHILGSGWAPPCDERVIATGGPVRRAQVMSRAKVVVQADVTGERLVDALLAAGSGAVLVARAHPADGRPGGLRQLLKPGEEMVFFSTARELIGHLRRLLGDQAGRLAVAERGWRRCCDQHSAAARLQTLRAAVTSFATVRGA